MTHDSRLGVDILAFPGVEDPIALFFDVVVNVTHEGQPLYYYIGFIEVPSVGSYDLNVQAAEASGSLSSPNDTYFLNQWNLGLTHLFDAQWHPASARKRVTIGVIDSGISPMLRSHGGLDGVELLHEQVVVGETAIDENIDVPFSHALGIVSLLGDRNQDGDGIVSLVGSWNDVGCRIAGSPFLGDQTPIIRSYGVGVLGPISTAVAAAIHDAIDDGVDVINLGLAIGYSPLVEEAIHAALDAGIPVVASAGNYGKGGGKKEALFPANVDGVISVGSVDRRGKLSQFSAKHGVDILAPGEQVIVGAANDVWYEGNGTSYAAPHVTATVAMLKAANPDLSPDEIRAALERRATNRGNGGLGIVNAFASLNHVLPARERTAFTITPVACGVYTYITDKLEDWRSNRAGKAGEGYWWDEFTYDSQVDDDLYMTESVAAELPDQIGLTGNYPNPFNPSTTIQFVVNGSQEVSLSVYNALGQQVRVLYEGRVEAGKYDAVFDADGLPSGIYIAQLRTESGTFTQKMVLTK